MLEALIKERKIMNNEQVETIVEALAKIAKELEMTNVYLGRISAKLR